MSNLALCLIISMPLQSNAKKGSKVKLIPIQGLGKHVEKSGEATACGVKCIELKV